MTAVIDIECPNCSRTASVQKLDLDRYRCQHCGHEFGHDAIIPE